MKKYLASIILSPLIGVLALLALAEMQFEPSWQKNYVGMTEAEAIGFLGQRDARDFDGDYWCNGYSVFGHKISTKALFLPLGMEPELRVHSQHIISFPEVLICWMTIHGGANESLHEKRRDKAAPRS